MDRIYSRKRIRIPKIQAIRNNNRNSKKERTVKVTLIVIVAFTTAIFIIRSISPMFNLLCTEKAKGIATEILNIEASKILKDVNYEALVNISKDSSGNINMIQINTMKINLIATEIAYNIQQELYKTNSSKIEIPFRKYIWKQVYCRIWTKNKYKHNADTEVF